MKNSLKFIIAALALVSAQILTANSCVAATENSIVGTVKPGGYNENQFPSNFRVSMLGGSVMPSTAGQKGFTGGLLMDYGRRWFGLEAGVQYLNLPVTVKVSNPYVGAAQGAVLMPLTANPQYVGVPVYVKLNYIEHPQAAFSLKAGAMPVFLVTDQMAASDSSVTNGGQVGLQIPGSDVLLVGGFTGSAPLSDSLAFILDGTYYYGSTILDQFGNTRHEGMIFGVGLRYSL